MALFKSNTMTQASGSVAGTTYSHNRFGLYMRARRTPVNPNTSFQQAVRSAFAAGSAAWRALTAAVRTNWRAYAAATPTTNRLGDTVYLTGAQQFTATYALATQLGLAVPAAAPVSTGRVSIGAPVVAATSSDTTIAVSGLNAALNITGKVGIYVGSPVSAGVTFYAGPYQLVHSAAPAAGSISDAAATARNGQALAEGQILPVRIAGIAADGRLTTVWQGLVTVLGV